MSFLTEMDRYLTIRRQLGADLSTDERILRRFVTFADRDGAQHVNASLVMRWLESLPSASAGTCAARMWCLAPALISAVSAKVGKNAARLFVVIPPN